MHMVGFRHFADTTLSYLYCWPVRTASWYACYAFNRSIHELLEFFVWQGACLRDCLIAKEPRVIIRHGPMSTPNHNVEQETCDKKDETLQCACQLSSIVKPVVSSELETYAKSIDRPRDRPSYKFSNLEIAG